MVSVRASEEEVRPLLGVGVDIAAVNGPGSVVVSGARDAVEELAGRLEVLGCRTKSLSVSHAFHSRLMDPMLAAFEEVAGSVTYAEPVIAMPPVDGVRDAAYWVRHVRDAVRFADDMRSLAAAGVDRFVELGPQSVLTAAAAENLPEDTPARFVASARRGAGEVAGVLTALTELHVLGQDIDWTPLFEGTGATHTDLPTYAFQRERFWQQVSTSGGDVTSVGLEAAGHPWLGAVTALADGEGHVFSGRISLRAFPWLADHAVFGTVIVPGTALLELALSAGHFVGAARVEELTLLEALVLPEQGELRLQVTVDAADAEGHRPVTVYSSAAAADAPWVRHAEGTLTGPIPISSTPSDEFEALAQWPVPGAQRMDLDGFYERFAEQGIAYGPAFRGLSELWRDGDTAYGLVRLPEDASTDGYGIHPALLDTALHVLKGSAAARERLEGALLP
ncbi:polyketide synthase dehydratase domain-containing protein, partial [Streptomyces sp. NPDC002996]